MCSTCRVLGQLVGLRVQLLLVFSCFGNRLLQLLDAILHKNQHIC